MKTTSSQKSLDLKKTPPTKGLIPGKKVPAFRLLSTAGGEVSSRSLLGTSYVLYFYPKDMTSGCTVEAHEFSSLAKKFAKEGVSLFGVSPDDIKSHMKFIEKEKISFPLLSDLEHKVAEKFGIWVEKKLYGRSYMGIERSTFVVNTEGVITGVYRNVKPEGHAVCVLSDAKAGVTE
jgi:thioredoxin-dependent peroxiredoxin